MGNTATHVRLWFKTIVSWVRTPPTKATSMDIDTDTKNSIVVFKCGPILKIALWTTFHPFTPRWRYALVGLMHTQLATQPQNNIHTYRIVLYMYCTCTGLTLSTRHWAARKGHLMERKYHTLAPRLDYSAIAIALVSCCTCKWVWPHTGLMGCSCTGQVSTSTS